MMLQMAQILPREIQGILACCNPVPPLVKQNLNQLHMIILRSREKPLEVVEEKKRLSCLPNNLVSAFESKHDISFVEPDFDHVLLESAPVTPKKTRQFNGSPLFNFLSERRAKQEASLSNVVSPFERYSLALTRKPIIKNMEEMLAEAKAESKKSNEPQVMIVDDDEEIESVEQNGDSIPVSKISKRKSKGVKPANINPHVYSQVDFNTFRKDVDERVKKVGKQQVNDKPDQEWNHNRSDKNEDQPQSKKFSRNKKRKSGEFRRGNRSMTYTPK